MTRFHVFLSHNSKDKPAVLPIAEQLKSRGLTVWLDEWNLIPGRDWQAALEYIIENASCAAVFVGRDGLGPWEIAEMRACLAEFVRREMPVIPVLLPGAPECPELPLFLRRYTWVDLRGGISPSGIDRLEWGITGHEANAKIHTGAPVAISISRLPITGETFAGRREELAQLQAAWDDPGVYILSVIAWGGVGKSALVNHWLAEMQAQAYRGAARVFGWSFYSQGAGGDRAASADQFIQSALQWFGDTDATIGGPHERGERLARLVRRQRTLLVVDGVEPLQHPPGPNAGRLKDPALSALLRDLAASNNGLCIVTTREPILDIAAHRRTTAPCLMLEQLSPRAGAELLRELGVEGKIGELEQASAEFGGHALALTLLGTFLRDVHDGDVSRRSAVALLDQDEEQGGHAHRVMKSYVEWFKSNGRNAEAALLRCLGLFDRPADAGAISALRERPIQDLTDALTNLSDAQWKYATARLRQAGLVARADDVNEGTLDTHPLVREYFAKCLLRQRPSAWKEGHSRLYEYFTTSVRELPETLDEMMPLFSAVFHGCAASRDEEAFSKTYWRRIQRGTEFFSLKTLGAIVADTAALANFFERLWDRPKPGLSPKSRALLLDQAGESLHTLGRLPEALTAMQALRQIGLQTGASKEAIKAAITLSELSLSMGKLADAVRYARESILYADGRAGKFHRQVSRSALAEALHQIGDLEAAEKWFSEAEAIERERRPNRPLLSSMQGYAYCDFLIAKGDFTAVHARGKQMLEWAEADNSLLAVALSNLVLGKAHCYIGSEGVGSPKLAEAAREIETGVRWLERAGAESRLPRGLLARAEVRRLQGDFGSAKADLDEVVEIASRDGMVLHEADCYLQRARVQISAGEISEAKKSLTDADRLIRDSGYGRRATLLRELAAVLGCEGSI